MAFEPTHKVGSTAVPTWPTADRSQPPGPELSAGLEVRVIDRQGDLAKVQCSNDWEAWVDNGSLELIVATAPSVAASPVGGPPPVNTAAAASSRPAWLVPAAIGAVVVILIAVFAMQGGDDKKTDGASTSKTTSGGSASKTLNAVDLLPSKAAVATAAGGTWVTAEGTACDTKGDTEFSGDDCSDLDSFNFLCADEFLESPVPETRAERRDYQRVGAESELVGATIVMQSAVFTNEAEAEDALKTVEHAYTEVCDDDPDSSSVMSPLAVDRVGDDQIGGHQTDLDSDYAEDHVWFRFGRALVKFEIREGKDLPKTVLRDLAQAAGANAG